MDELIFKLTTDIAGKRAKIIEEHLRLRIKPKPNWMPTGIWKWLLKKLMYLEQS